MAGYSGTPLPAKLGIKDGAAVVVLGGPSDLAKSLGAATRITKGTYDVIVAFVTKRAEVGEAVARLRRHMNPACGLWIAWPKKSSGVATDVTEQTIRDIALPTGLVDNKVCAIDDIWSGLRLVIRKELR